MLTPSTFHQLNTSRNTSKQWLDGWKPSNAGSSFVFPPPRFRVFQPWPPAPHPPLLCKFASFFLKERTREAFNKLRDDSNAKAAAISESHESSHVSLEDP